MLVASIALLGIARKTSLVLVGRFCMLPLFTPYTCKAARYSKHATQVQSKHKHKTCVAAVPAVMNCD